jgi:hypothetical protein
MKLTRNKVVRITSSNSIAVRHWGKLAQVSTFQPLRTLSGLFKGTSVVVRVNGRKAPLVVSKSVLVER